MQPSDSKQQRSVLARTLGAWRQGNKLPARSDFPERLAQWLHVSDAITLRNIHQRVERAAVHQATGSESGVQDLSQALEQLRATLTRSIREELQRLLRESRETGVDADPDVELALHQQLFDDMQRRMEMSVEALRAHVRDVLSRQSPQLARLATMDAALAQMLRGREQEALSATVPMLLRQRFDQLRKAYAERESAAQTELPLGGQVADARVVRNNAYPPSHWLPQFSLSLQSALVAELEHRLLPVIGMIEALGETHL